MTINELKNHVSGLSENEILVNSISLVRRFLSVGDEMNAKLGEGFDFRNVLSMIFSAAITANGELGVNQYAMYRVICDNNNIEAKEYEDCQEILPNASAYIDNFQNIGNGLRNVFANIGQSEAFDDLCVVIASLMIYGGSLEGEEIRLLSYFVGEEVATGNFSSPQVSSTQDVKLVDYAATFTRKDDCYHFTIGAELKNPNTKHCAKSVRVKVIVKDAAGRILESSENTIEYIDSNATFYYGDEFRIDRGTPANYSVQVNCDEFVSAPENSTFANGIACSHYNLNTNRWGSIEFTGNVRNGYNKKLWTTLYFTFYNSAGKITGGANSRTLVLYGNAEDVFEIYLDTSISRDKVRCSPAFDFMDLVD